MLPRDWPLVVSEETKAQFEAVRKVLTAPEVERRRLRHRRRPRGRADLPLHLRGRRAAGSRSSASGSPRSPPTPSARASASCATARDFDPLADAARGRSRADWLVGMNLSRAYSLGFDEDSSPSAACRRRRSPWWSSASWRSAPSCPRTTSRSWRRSRRAGGRESAARYAGTWFRGELQPGGQADKRRRAAAGDGSRRGDSASSSACARGKAAVESVARRDASGCRRRSSTT